MLAGRAWPPDADTVGPESLKRPRPVLACTGNPEAWTA